MTKESFDQAQNELEQAELAAGSVSTEGMNETQAKLINLCSLYAQMRPAIKFAKGVIFFWHKGQEKIQQFMDSMDATCEIS